MSIGIRVTRTADENGSGPLPARVSSRIIRASSLKSGNLPASPFDYPPHDAPYMV
jgi:hypothetical protein